MHKIISSINRDAYYQLAMLDNDRIVDTGIILGDAIESFIPTMIEKGMLLKLSERLLSDEEAMKIAMEL